MAYGIRYYGNFDSFRNDVALQFSVEIWQKDYSGDTQEILLSGVPVIHEWQDEERNKPIKGSSLKIGMINNNQGIKLETFYSDDDFKYQVILRQRSTDAILFNGYIIQDECSEIMADFNHEISITATDMLGTLKEISLLDAAQKYGTLTTFYGIQLSCLSPTTLQTNDTTVANLKAGQVITILNGSFAGTYTIINITYDTVFNYRLYFSGTSFPTFTTETDDMEWRVPTDLTVYRSLAEILRLCLQSTNLQLGTKVISQIFPVGSDTQRWLDGTYILGTSFLKNQVWMNCYDVMEAILDRFRATLFQSKGFWWIIRFDEIFNGIVMPELVNYKGYLYDSEFHYDGDIETTENSIGFNYSTFEFGFLKSIERPVAYTKDSFNFEQTDDLLKNANLQILGALLDVTTTGTGTSLVTEYEYANDFWYPWDDHPSPTPDIRIRVRKDYLGNEIERYLTLDGSTFTDTFAKMSNDIQLQKGDIITWSFQIRTETSQPGPVNLLFGVRIKNCIDADLYMDENGIFSTTPGNIHFSIRTGDNLNEWHDVSVTSVALPIDCIMNVFLTKALVKTHYKDFRFEIKRAQNNLGFVTGQSHIYTNPTLINNVLEKDIKIDNSPSATISGTLFLDNYTGCIRNLTKSWAYAYTGYFEFENLGKLVLAEELFINNKSRYKYDGNLLNLIKGFPADYIIGPESTIYLQDAYSTIRLIFGKLSIDYKNNRADVTLNYIGDYNQSFADFLANYIYSFNYLYQNN